MKRFIQIAVLAALISLAVAENQCKQYLTCPECLDLNVTAPFQPGYGKHEDCGWCHVPIKYEDGHEGARCADIRDDPWNCGDQYDTATCSPGWACDTGSGKCIMANPGDGYGSKSTCDQICGAHHNNTGTYRCNTTIGVCEACKKDDEGCGPDRTVQCGNCQPPPPPAGKKFKCDKTDKENPKCNECKEGSQEGCSDKNTACKSCHKPEKLFECDEKTLTCVQAKNQGNIKQACDAQCGHITPQELLGTWRGLQAKLGPAKNFDMGEFDMVFGDKNLTFKYPNRTQEVYDVATTGGSTLILQKAGHTIKVVHNILANLKHTTAAGLSTFGPDKEAPDSFRRGMETTKAMDLIMWKCNTWGGQGTCMFKNSTTEQQEKIPEDAIVPIDNSIQDGPSDECNSFGDCHTCIAKHEGVRCGWCLGGTLSYRGIGKTVYKCGGFKAGQPYNFTCPADFRTTNCQGYACHWENKTCSVSDDGQFPDALSCGEACRAEMTFSKCDHETKKCSKCEEGSEGCNTAAFCAATCGKPHAKCDAGTGKCSECDPAKDPKFCNQVKEACDSECQIQSLSKCDLQTGKCNKCTEGEGCVPTASCEQTCTHPHPPEHHKYKCDWAHAEPQCIADEGATQNKTECEQKCQQPSFAKCNFQNNTCEKCDHTKDKDCLYTMDYCKQAQKEGECKKDTLSGLYRMIEVNPGYDVGEFDVLFKEGKMIMQEFVSKLEAKDLGTLKETGAAEGGGVTFEVTDWKPEPKIWGKDKLFGVYKTTHGETNTFTFIELAFSDHKITKLDDGLTGRYFVGAACKTDPSGSGEKICDFTKATPKEEQTSQYAKFKFLMG